VHGLIDPPDDDNDGAGARPPFAAAGACSVGPMFPPGACNGKIATARYFAGGAAATLPLDPSRDLSPFDAEGHGWCALYYNLQFTGNSEEQYGSSLVCFAAMLLQ